MNPFKYSDDENINETQLTIALPSAIIGVAILSLPREVAIVTLHSDGWISILLAGILSTFIAVLGAKVAAQYQDKSFYDYTSFLVTKPIAIVIVAINIIIAIYLCAYATRNIAYISQQYLFEQTPIEVLALTFLLVVVYAVSGSRAGIFRLNLLFLPIILIAFLFVGIFNFTWIESSNYLPLFKTSFRDYLIGVTKSFEAYLGFQIVLFYVLIVHNPKKLTKTVVTGMSIPVIFYLFIYMMTIGIFGNEVTANLEFPTVELAKRVDIPGGILERIDPIVFSIWIMAIFNTTAIMFDVAIFLFSSIYTKTNKRLLTFIFAPIIYYVAMFPQQIDDVKAITEVMSQFIAYFSIVLIFGLYIIAKMRGGQKNDKNNRTN